MNWEERFRSRKFWIVLVCLSIIISSLVSWVIYTLIRLQQPYIPLSEKSLVYFTKSTLSWLFIGPFTVWGFPLFSVLAWILFVLFLIKIKDLNRKWLKGLGLTIFFLIILIAAGFTIVTVMIAGWA